VNVSGACWGGVGAAGPWWAARREASDAFEVLSGASSDQARIRRDLHLLRIGDESVTDLKILTGRRMDLVADRTRIVNQLRAQLTSVFPGLEGALDLTNTGPP
jgi:hypothetical protein